jgi:hypothetical protein
MATKPRKNGKKKTGLLTYLKWAGAIGAGAVIGHIATQAYKDRFEKPREQGQVSQNPLFGAFNPFDTRGGAPQINVFAAGAPKPPPPPEPAPPAPPPDMRPSLTTFDDGEEL